MRLHQATGLLVAFTLGCGDDVAGPPPIPIPIPTTTSLALHITAGGAPVPAKVLLTPVGGTPLRIGRLDFLEGRVQDRGYCLVADGAVGTWEGIALARGDAELPIGVPVCDGVVAIPYGRYRVRIMRGAEFEFFDTEVDLSADHGRVFIEAPLERAFSAPGYLAADLHVHAENSGDSIVPRYIRVITEAAAGIQVIGSSDHNFNGDYRDEIEALEMTSLVASLPGNEVSVDVGHFNIFPVRVEDGRARGGSMGDYAELHGLSARQLFDRIRALPGLPFLQVNHARLGYAAYFDLAGWDGRSWPPPMPVDFDALEVLTGWTSFNHANDRRLDRTVADFYTLAEKGRFVTALGNSDTHHLMHILAGFPRSYVRVPDARLAPFDEAGFMEALRTRRAVATTGPWLEVEVNGVGPGGLAVATGGGVDVTIRVRQASYVHAERVRLIIGGQVRERLDLPPGAKQLDWTGHEPVGPGDTWIGVDAAGDQPLPPELVGSYLTDQSGMLPFALINPILVDVDGNGWNAPVQATVTGSDFAMPPGTNARGPYDCGEGLGVAF